ncbi:recombinase family protein [Oceaniradius stylonematis]|uniref:recombinase family protein n=1 Tax=Oceaniradius stylonematis TaxID=2184161 RepID=UPI00273E8BF6|nr:recombinase family protein [Oceaniradius stylonematis]
MTDTLEKGRLGPSFDDFALEHGLERHAIAAFIYCRSAVADLDAIASQEAACRAYADTHGLRIVGVYSDNGVSGMDASRSELSVLIKAVAAQEQPCVVLVDGTERIARDLDALKDVKQRLQMAGATLCSIGSPASDER